MSCVRSGVWSECPSRSSRVSTSSQSLNNSACPGPPSHPRRPGYHGVPCTPRHRPTDRASSDQESGKLRILGRAEHRPIRAAGATGRALEADVYALTSKSPTFLPSRDRHIWSRCPQVRVVLVTPTRMSGLGATLTSRDRASFHATSLIWNALKVSPIRSRPWSQWWSQTTGAEWRQPAPAKEAHFVIAHLHFPFRRSTAFASRGPPFRPSRGPFSCDAGARWGR